MALTSQMCGYKRYLCLSQILSNEKFSKVGINDEASRTRINAHFPQILVNYKLPEIGITEKVSQNGMRVERPTFLTGDQREGTNARGPTPGDQRDQRDQRDQTYMNSKLLLAS